MAEDKGFIKNFMVLFSGNTLSQIVPFLFAPIITRIYSEEQLGLYGNVLAIAGLIAVISGGRLENAIVLPKEESEAQTLFNISFRSIVGFFFLSFVLILFKFQIAEFYEAPELSNYLLYVPFGVLFIAFNNLMVQWALRQKGYGKISISKIALTLVLNSFQVVLGYLGFGIYGMLIGWLSGWLTSVVMFWFTNKPVFASITKFKFILKKYIDFPTTNALHAFTDIFFTQAVLLAIITKNFELAAAGAYMIMDRYLRAPVRLVGTSVGQLYYKEASEALNEGNSPIPIFLKSVKITIAFAIPFLAVLSLWAPDLFEWYFGDNMKKAGEFAQIMAFPIALNLIVSPLSSTPLIYNKQKISYAFSLLGYSLSMGGLVYGISNDFEVVDTLKFYAVGQMFYYVILLIWFRMLIRR